MDASQSHDPDMEWGTEMDLTFEWYCKRNNKDLKGVALEEFNPILANSDKVRYPKAPDPSTTNDSLPRDNFIGCFGSKIGILDGAGSFLFSFLTFLAFGQRILQNLVSKKKL